MTSLKRVLCVVTWVVAFSTGPWGCGDSTNDDGSGAGESGTGNGGSSGPGGQCDHDWSPVLEALESLAHGLGECSVDADCVAVQPEYDCPFGSSCGYLIASGNEAAFANGVIQINEDYCIGGNWCGGHGDCFPTAVCRSGFCEWDHSPPGAAPPDDDAGTIP